MWDTGLLITFCSQLTWQFQKLEWVQSPLISKRFALEREKLSSFDLKILRRFLVNGTTIINQIQQQFESLKMLKSFQFTQKLAIFYLVKNKLLTSYSLLHMKSRSIVSCNLSARITPKLSHLKLKDKEFTMLLTLKRIR